MYVCMCNALTDKQIAAVVAAGADRPHDVYAACGCRAQCGGCTGTILSMVRAGCSAGGK
ncbi:(2Fe-2S)-binding protein [Falsiroseomonas tokyonensis]|uniref:Bacterioferritin-associated ferredoxin n=1 Tax=Falsiroseomonas tokyonensis TaxID=430521 RepID=A0ABV7BY44_9PROT|nr:(2Fe-2S)-binding protein [Falsiroseomonas tokyonensis]MBU8539929.1 (2Fe-2S)-binding protein [Falsiroseomonas tokyonensis]